MSLHKIKKPEEKLIDGLSSLLENSSGSDILPLKSKHTEKKSPNTLKKPQKNSNIAEQVISYQTEKINKLKKEKLKLTAQVLNLEAQVRILSGFSSAIKKKDREISKLRSTLLKKTSMPLFIPIKKRINSFSNTIELSSQEDLLRKKIHSTKTFIKYPSTICNSQTSSTRNSVVNNNNMSTLNEVFMKTEKILKYWKKLYKNNRKYSKEASSMDLLRR